MSSGKVWNKLLLIFNIFNECKSFRFPPPESEDSPLLSNRNDSLRKTLHKEYIPFGTTLRSQSVKSKIGSGFSRAYQKYKYGKYSLNTNTLIKTY